MQYSAFAIDESRRSKRTVGKVIFAGTSFRTHRLFFQAYDLRGSGRGSFVFRMTAARSEFVQDQVQKSWAFS